MTAPGTAITTAKSTDDWAAWWANERIRTETDWKSLLRQHGCFFQQLSQLHGLSS